jgi:hypothetical protein
MDAYLEFFSVDAGDLYKVLGVDQASYQASSIHSRRHSPYASTNDLVRPESPAPLPPPTLTPRERRERSRKERRLLSELWLMSAATFRRSGKIEQARGAIQEAEVRDEENPNVWVQVSKHVVVSQSPDIVIFKHAEKNNNYTTVGIVPHRARAPGSRRTGVQQGSVHLSRQHPRHRPSEPGVSHTREGGGVGGGQHRLGRGDVVRSYAGTGLGCPRGVVFLGEGSWDARHARPGARMPRLCSRPRGRPPTARFRRGSWMVLVVGIQSLGPTPRYYYHARCASMYPA